MPIKRLLISILLLAASLGILWLLVATPLSELAYAGALAHSSILLIITAVLFFICFYSFQNYSREKDIQWYFASLAFYVLGVSGFIHAALVPSFGWGSEELFHIFEHFGFLLASLILYGLFVSFSYRVQEKTYQARFKIFLGLNIFLLTGVAALFFLPLLAVQLYRIIDVAGLVGSANFIVLYLISLSRKPNNFVRDYLPAALALFAVTAAVPLFAKEWGMAWWYYHYLWLTVSLLLLTGIKRERGTAELILLSDVSIRTRLFLFVGLTLAVIFINGYVALRLSQGHLKDQMLEELTLISKTQESQITAYLEKLKGRTIDFSSDGAIRGYLEQILSGDQPAVSDLNRHLAVNKQSLDSAIVGLHVLDVNGRVVASAQENAVGQADFADDEVFGQANKSPYGNANLSSITEDFRFEKKQTVIRAAAPLIDVRGSHNIGVLMLYFKPDGLWDILSGRAQTLMGTLATWSGPQQAMERYLVNEEGLMISESRFIANAPLQQAVDTEPVNLCKGFEEMRGEYFNYRDILVFGVSTCLPNGWTLLVEIDKATALAPLNDYVQQSLLSGSVTLLPVLIAVYLFTVGINVPLRKLFAAARNIGAGNFSYRVDLATHDEFGTLSNAFNQMAQNVQKSSADLQQKLKNEEASRRALSAILADLDASKNQLEQAKARDEAVLASIGDGLVVMDREGRIVLVNVMFEQLLGWRGSEVLGQLFVKVVPLLKESGTPLPEPERFITKALNKQTAQTAATHADVSYQRKDGTTFPVQITVSPIIIQPEFNV